MECSPVVAVILDRAQGDLAGVQKRLFEIVQCHGHRLCCQVRIDRRSSLFSQVLSESAVLRLGETKIPTAAAYGGGDSQTGSWLGGQDCSICITIQIRRLAHGKSGFVSVRKDCCPTSGAFLAGATAEGRGIRQGACGPAVIVILNEWKVCRFVFSLSIGRIVQPSGNRCNISDNGKSAGHNTETHAPSGLALDPCRRPGILELCWCAVAGISDSYQATSAECI